MLKLSSCLALSFGAAALLAGCGVLPPSLSKGLPQNGAFARHVDRSTSWALSETVPDHRYVLHVLYRFNGLDGDDPAGNVTYLDGSFYGDTTFGGALGAYGGVVYAVTPSGDERTLHDFGGGTDGQNPISGLVIAHHEFFGATVYGGEFGSGAVFAIDSSGNERVAHSFGHGSDGSYPLSGLTNLDGTLYGTTSEGGRYGFGTVYSIGRTGREKVVYSFRGGRDAADPQEDLTAVGGVLYGTTPDGGDISVREIGCGTIYSLTTAGKEHVIYRFHHDAPGSGSILPTALTNINGVLYGATKIGGDHHAGTLFTSSLSGTVRVLHVFSGGLDGGRPAQPIDVKGTLYGRTSSGGRHNGGLIYRMTRSGREAVIYDFPPCSHCGGTLMQLGNGFYGTLVAGYGAFFRLAP